MTKDNKKTRIFYGWFIIAYCCITILLTYGIGYNILTVFNIPMCETTGMTRQQFNALYTAMSAAQIIFSFNANRIIRKLGLLNTMRAGTVLFCLTTLFSCYIRNAVQICIMGFLYGPTMLTGGFFCLSMIIANWFKEKRGIATGIVFMSSGLGSFFLIPLANTWIENLGWQKARMIFFLICLAIVPVTFFLIKEKPEDMGLEPLGSDALEQKAPAEEDLWGYERKELFRLPGAYLYLFYIISLNFCVSLGSTVVPYLQDVGYTAAFASRVQSFNMLSLAVGRLSTGILCDRFSVRKTGNFCILLAPTVLIGIILADRFSWSIGLLIFGYAVSMALNSVLNTLLTGKLFGRKHFAAVYGLFSAVGSMTGATPPLIYGKVYAERGTYLPCYKVFLCIYLVGICCYFLAVKITKKKEEPQEA